MFAGLNAFAAAVFFWLGDSFLAVVVLLWRVWVLAPSPSVRIGRILARAMWVGTTVNVKDTPELLVASTY